MTAIPVNVITGALGAGKTTAIAQLLASKPSHESWLVILNEFTDTGIDTLTLASAARGAYDVRTIPGGCLCCTGEEDFRRQLSALCARPLEQRPARILIEPSGIAHPGAIVDELRGFERSGALELRSVVCLLEPSSLASLASLSTVMREQLEAADVVLLSKAERTSDADRTCFLDWSAGLFPAKRYIGLSERGVLPELALIPPVRASTFDAFAIESVATIDEVHSRRAVIDSASVSVRSVVMSTATAQARSQHWLQRDACGWVVPPEVIFDARRVEQTFANSHLLAQAERIKAVLRVGIDKWCLFQRWNAQSASDESAWHQDSRIEVQLPPALTADWKQWDALWQSLVECSA